MSNVKWVCDRIVPSTRGQQMCLSWNWRNSTVIEGPGYLQSRLPATQNSIVVGKLAVVLDPYPLGGVAWLKLLTRSGDLDILSLPRPRL